jgi:transposase-like protein
MTKRTRRRFTQEFKDGAVGRLAEPGASYSSVAGELGITASQVRTWHLEQLAEGSADAIAAREAESAELARLRKENRRLKEEVEVMRKASAFFAQWATKK